MSTYDKKKPANAIVPLVRVASPEQAIEMTGIAKEAGVGGVFLTDIRSMSGYDPDDLPEAAIAVKDTFEDFWVGANPQIKDATHSMRIFGDEIGIDGVWQNNVLGWTESLKLDASNMAAFVPYGKSLNIYRARNNSVLFGGIAEAEMGSIYDNPFKAAAYAEFAQHFVDIAVTGGINGDVQKTLDCLREIKRAIGGETPIAAVIDWQEKLGKFLINADYLIVVKGIEVKAGYFDPHRLDELVYQYNAASEELPSLIENKSA